MQIMIVKYLFFLFPVYEQSVKYERLKVRKYPEENSAEYSLSVFFYENNLLKKGKELYFFVKKQSIKEGGLYKKCQKKLFFSS